MKRKLLSILITLMLLVAIMPIDSAAYADKQPGAQVNITIPDFAVTINGAAMEKSYSKYPVFVYAGITYFPMTYDGCRYLGLETEWQQQEGLAINKTNISLPLKTYRTTQKNATHYTATVPAFNVVVNGQKVANNNAEYPLLLFRNVTYFPLTWQYGVELFGWDYHFDNQRGLVIKSQNAVPEITNLIDYDAAGDFIVNGNAVYYSGNQGRIYQTSLDNLTQNKAIYQLPKDTAWGENTHAKPYFSKRDGLVSFSYSQTGGNSMTHRVDINPDGTTTEPQAIGPFIAPETSADGYLLYKYGERVFETETDRYMITSNIKIADDVQRIYKLNKATQQITRVTEKVAESFKYRNQKLYFVSDDKKLYSLSLSDERVVLESNGPILGDNYEVLGDSIYYVNAADQKLYLSGEVQPLNGGETVEAIELKGDYIVVKYNTTLDKSYRTVVYDKFGDAVFILPRQIGVVSADSNRIIYYDLVDNQVFMARIK